jgi:hypothetical protein
MEENHPTVMSEDEMTNQAFQLLTEFSSNTLQALIDVAGSEKAIELKRPYFYHHGKAGALSIGKRLGVTENDMSDVILAGRFVSWVLRKETHTVGVPTEGFSRSEVSSCPFQDGPAEFCELFDIITAKGFSEEIGPDYEYSCEQMMTRGAPICLTTTRRKPGIRNNPEDADEVISVPQLPEISNEERDYWAIQILAEHWILTTRALMDYENSDRALNLLKVRMKLQGISTGLRFSKMLGMNGNDALAIASLVDFCNSLFQQEGKVTHSSPARIEKEISQCPFQYAPREICIQFEAFTNGICEAVNPDYEVVHVKAMCKGDSSCIRVIRRRGAEEPAKKEALEPQKESPKVSEDDHLRILKIRLAKGEITKREYEELWELLSD